MFRKLDLCECATTCDMYSSSVETYLMTPSPLNPLTLSPATGPRAGHGHRAAQDSSCRLVQGGVLEVGIVELVRRQHAGPGRDE